MSKRVHEPPRRSLAAVTSLRPIPAGPSRARRHRSGRPPVGRARIGLVGRDEVALVVAVRPLAIVANGRVAYHEAWPIEIFYADRVLAKSFGAPAAGWFRWSCLPGCLPDGPPTGPVGTCYAAYRDVLDYPSPQACFGRWAFLISNTVGRFHMRRASDPERAQFRVGCFPPASPQISRKRFWPLRAITACNLRSFGAGEGIRTLDPNLGKVVLYP
jgi:hypothetical protein